MAPVTKARLITADELSRMPDAGRCELIDGELHSMSPAGYEHGGLAGNLHGLLWQHARHARLGRVFAAETGFVIRTDPDTVRAADVAFVAANRLPPAQRGFFPGPPDLAVEVVSPSDRVADVEDKVQDWLDAGVRLVWVVWPATRTVSVYRPGSTPVTLRDTDTLDGGDVVPQFQCKVAEVFE